jgi:hypothetical protein
LSAAWAKRRLRALVVHGHWSFRLQMSPTPELGSRADECLRI